MPKFSLTESALAKLPGTMSDGRGRHNGSEIKTGVPGIKIGEVEYDPSRHSPMDIDHFSTMGMMTGKPYVRQVIPHRPIEAKIILFNDESTGDTELSRTKNILATSLGSGLSSSMPAIRDRVKCFIVGDPNNDTTQRLAHLNPTFIEAIGDPEAAALEVSKLCLNGLAFVISDFENLPLQDLGSNFQNTVGIKVNNLIDVDISDLKGTRGVLSLGGSREMRLWKKKEADPFNALLKQHDQEVASRLERVGIKVARVISDNTELNGFNLSSADKEIASAIKRL